MMRYFYKLNMISHDRILWKIFHYDHSHALNGTWSKEIKNILNMNDVYDSLEGWTMRSLTEAVNQQLRLNYDVIWVSDITNTSKLETYGTFKHIIETEKYVLCNFLTRYQRRMIAMCRAGTLPLEIEKGRWRGIPRDDRKCKSCSMNVVDDLKHFMITCPALHTRRNTLMNDISRTLNVAHFDLTLHNLFTCDLILKLVANFVIDGMNIRK